MRKGKERKNAAGIYILSFWGRRWKQVSLRLEDLSHFHTLSHTLTLTLALFDCRWGELGEEKHSGD